MKTVARYTLLSACALLSMVESRGQDEKEKTKPKIDLMYSYDGEGTRPVLTVSVKVRAESRFEPVSGVAVDLFMNGEEEADRIASAVTDSKGTARAEISGAQVVRWDSLSEFEFTAYAAESEVSRKGSKSITIRKARLGITADVVDSVRTLRARLEDWQDGWAPVAEADIKFTIRRSFGMLQASEDLVTTDESGAASSEFETSIPGDSLGNLELLALLEDHEDYGTLSASITVPWGTPTVAGEDFFDQRALWSSRSRAPWWLLLFPNLVLLGVWSSIVHIVILLVRIRRSAKNPVSP